MRQNWKEVLLLGVPVENCLACLWTWALILSLSKTFVSCYAARNRSMMHSIELISRTSTLSAGLPSLAVGASSSLSNIAAHVERLTADARLHVCRLRKYVSSRTLY
jgi:hypothetical protein